MTRPTPPLDWLILAILVAAWGSSFAMTKIAVTHLDAAWVMALRLSIAGIFLMAVVAIGKRKLPRDWRLWGWFTWLGVIGHAAPFFLITWGTHYVTSGLSGVLMGAVPLFVIVLAHFFLPDEPLTPMKSAGFAAGFVGLMIVLGPQKLLHLSSGGMALWGEIAIIAGCLCYAVHGLFARRIPFHGPVEQSAAVCTMGGLIGVCFALARAPHGLADVPPSAYLAVLGLGLVPTAMATLLMYRLVRDAGVSFIAYSNYLVPVYALLFGALTLGEELSWNVAAGLVFILAGIAVSRIKPRRAMEPA
jgi:drug/metabolite transporter (DMT)-like permease